jgi:hypothetical protein
MFHLKKKNCYDNMDKLDTSCAEVFSKKYVLFFIQYDQVVYFFHWSYFFFSFGKFLKITGFRCKLPPHPASTIDDII